MKYVYIFMVIAVTILIALFASQNTSLVAVSFFSLSATGPLSLALVIAFTTGILLGLLIMIPAVISGSFRHFITKLKLRKLEKGKKKATAAKVLESQTRPDSSNKASDASTLPDQSAATDQTGNKTP